MDRIRSPTVNSISDYNHNTHIDTHIETHTDTQWHTELSLPKHHRIGNFFQLFASLTTLIRMVLFNKQSTSMHLLTLNLTDDSFSFANLKKMKNYIRQHKSKENSLATVNVGFSVSKQICVQITAAKHFFAGTIFRFL